MKRICNAIASSTKEKCKKKALLGSKYCFYHIDKVSLLISCILCAIIGIFLTELYHRSIPSQELKALEDAEAREQIVIGQLTDLEKVHSDQSNEFSEQLSQIQTQLEPFVKLAKEKYPNIELSVALSKIQDDIKSINEIANRDIFKIPNQLIQNNTINALKHWHNMYPDLVVKVSLLNANTLNTEQVVQNIFRFLNSCKIKNEPVSISYITIGRKAPISIYTSDEVKSAAILFLDALRNYVTGEVYFEEKPENNFIEIKFCGIPRFSSNGSVVLE